ncbi:MAG TPA: amidohydrolase family protein [Chloroflexota bacterium]|nr:amidohydrolase family protein [Chloroflexota bacterium]
MSVDISGLRGIDIHTHIPRPPHMAPSRRAAQMAQYFRSPVMGMSVEEMVELYRRLRLMAVVFDIDATSTDNSPGVGNDYVAEVQRRYPDVLIGWASVDPWQGRAAVRELERAVTALGLRGLKLHPITQAFYPDDQRFYPLWAKAAELGIPVIFHTGHTGVGAGAPGGTGLKLKYARPIHLDDVAADFPSLTIIGAHPSWPWQDEMLSVALHKANVYFDLSGWSPKYFSPSLIQYANTLLQNKVLFGSDFPVISPERWLADFEAAPFRDEVRPKILLENARRVLGLAAAS